MLDRGELRSMSMRIAGVVFLLGTIWAFIIFQEPDSCVGDPVAACKPLRPFFYVVVGVTLVLFLIGRVSKPD